MPKKPPSAIAGDKPSAALEKRLAATFRKIEQEPTPAALTDHWRRLAGRGDRRS